MDNTENELRRATELAQGLVAACDALRTLAESLTPRPMGSLGEKYPWLTVAPADERERCESAMTAWLGAVAAGQRELGELLKPPLVDYLRAVMLAQAIDDLPEDAACAPSYHEAAYMLARNVLATVCGYAPRGTPVVEWYEHAHKYSVDWWNAADELRESPRVDARQLQKVIGKEGADAALRLLERPTATIRKKDDTSYVPVSQVWGERFPGQRYRTEKAIAFLNTHNISYRKPNGRKNRLDVHAGEWHRYWAAYDRKASDQTDEQENDPITGGTVDTQAFTQAAVKLAHKMRQNKRR